MTNEQMDKLQTMIDELPPLPWKIDRLGLIEASDETEEEFASDIGECGDWAENSAEYLVMCGNLMPEILAMLKEKR